LSWSFTGISWQNKFFNTSSNSFAAYYREVSYDKLRYYGDVAGIADGVPVTNSPNVAYVRLDKPITYYADDQYGLGTYPKNAAGVVYDALQKLDNAGFNFSQYATNGKLSNNLFVIYTEVVIML
jgi:immune inhibitor A